MKPGWNCLSCHREGGQASSKPWSAAGTIYGDADADVCDGVAGVNVIFTDADGVELTRVVSNEVGNFYTAFALPEGFRVALERQGRTVQMPISPPAGSCNACHDTPPLGDALGRIRAP